MVAGARLAIEAGWEVRGSDNPLYPPTSHMVKALGVPVASNYDAANLDWGPDLMVIGNALSRGNPEVEAALERRLCYLSLPEWLKTFVLRPRRPIVICGTHGKTTTTALAAHVLDRTGHNPGFLIGGEPLDFPFSARLGPKGAPFVIEGDEYDTAFFDKRAKFFHYIPEIAVVTSVEFDHGDLYQNLAEIERAFQLMLRQIPRSGRIVLCADDPGAAALRDHAYSQIVTYGFADHADWRIHQTGVSPYAGMTQATVHRGGAHYVDLEVPLAGRHNMRNVLAAVVVADLCGATPDAIGNALRAFRGIRRRMEVFLEAEGITFVDDFAHHPTAIRETIAAAREKWFSSSTHTNAHTAPIPSRKLWVLFEPRSNTTVTNVFQRELRQALADADEVWVGPLYRPERIPQERRLSRERLVAELAGDGVPAHAANEVRGIVEYLRHHGREGDVVLIMSNGDFGGIYERLRNAFGLTCK